MRGKIERWAGSVAVGSRCFVEKVKALLGFLSKGREVIEASDGYQVREKPAPYNGLLGAEKLDIGPENFYLWNVKPE
jgi:REP-associated tyrosine transposase